MRERIRLIGSDRSDRGRYYRTGAYSTAYGLAKLDKRSPEARLMSKVRRELLMHLPNPTVTQRMLVERCVILALRCAQIDKKIIAGEVFTTHDSNFALAWCNSLRRTLQALGLDGPVKMRHHRPIDATPHRLDDILAEAAE